MFLAVSYSGWAGAEMRAISAVDIALWDLFGKATGQPIYKLLGGASRPSMRIYNTCYDRVDFTTEPCQLARELLASKFAAMKIWPFDPIARETWRESHFGGATAACHRTIAADSRGIWRLDRCCHRVPRLLESAVRDQNRCRFRAVQADVAGRDVAAGQPGRLCGTGAFHRYSALSKRDG